MFYFNLIYEYKNIKPEQLFLDSTTFVKQIVLFIKKKNRFIQIIYNITLKHIT